jgi:hypothetical protein
LKEQTEYFKVNFMYYDGKQAEAMLDADRCNEMLKTLERGEVFWFDDLKKSGIWLDLNRVRYIQFRKQKRDFENEHNNSKVADNAPSSCEQSANGLQGAVR